MRIGIRTSINTGFKGAIRNHVSEPTVIVAPDVSPRLRLILGNLGSIQLSDV